MPYLWGRGVKGYSHCLRRCWSPADVEHAHDETVRPTSAEISRTDFVGEHAELAQ